MGKNLPFTLFVSLLCWGPLLAQSELAIGEWQSHLPYSNGAWVTQSNSKVYYATEWSIMIIEKSDRSRQYLSKVNGLSNVGISTLKFNRPANILIVVYTNGVIDLIKETETVTLFDVANFEGLGDIEIFDIFIEDAGAVFLVANYGISKLNLNNNEFSYTTFTGVPVNSFTQFKGYYYLAATDGLYRLPVTNTFPEDFNEWELLDEGEGFPNAYETGSMVVFQDELFLALDTTLARYDGTTLHPVYAAPNQGVKFLSAEGSRLITGLECGEGNCKGSVLYFNEDLSVESAPENCVDRPVYGIEDEEGTVWMADNWREFRYHEAGAESCNRLKPNAPYSHNIKEIKVYENEVWIASGGVLTNYAYLFREDGVFALLDGNWKVYNRNNTEAMNGLFDFYDLAIHPDSGTVYMASFYDGLIAYDGETFTLYNESNSTLDVAPGDTARTRVSGLAFDLNQDLWVSNHTAERPFSVLRAATGTWESFRPPSCFNETQVLQIAVDQNNYKWFALGSNSAGLLVFDEGDPSTPDDDRCRVISSNNSNLPINRVNCLEVDLDGDVWVGTEQGTIVFECGSNVFDENCTGSLRIVQQDDFGAYLLETENIRTIAVDGANRKWFGTENGIFVQSPDGEQQVAFFNTENSPLFDNIINDIAINQLTGEVYIGTNKGLQSFRGQATEGGILNKSNVLVFPNPVRPEYEGPIAISGLARDANVKITDVNGQLVYETIALGGQAVWDGRDYNGRRASSGVYLVFSTSTQRPDTPDAVVAKLLLLN